MKDIVLVPPEKTRKSDHLKVIGIGIAILIALLLIGYGLAATGIVNVPGITPNKTNGTVVTPPVEDDDEMPPPLPDQV